MDLAKRLEILSSTETITENIRDSMLKVIEMFDKKYKIALTEENGAIMITHLSMAMMRIKNNEPVKEISEEIYQEVLENEFLEETERIYLDLEKILEITLPEPERKYMFVNICSILNIVKN